MHRQFSHHHSLAQATSVNHFDRTLPCKLERLRKKKMSEKCQSVNCDSQSSFFRVRKYHYDLINGTNCENKNLEHIFKACSKFYETTTYSGASNKKKNYVISSVIYMENEATQKSFEDCKNSYNKHGISWVEDYLFHGTDKTKVDSIFTNNFDIDSEPVQGRTKVRNCYCS